MALQESGISISVRDTQPLKAQSSIIANSEGSLTDTRFTQSRNVLGQISVIVSGISTVVRLLQFSKAELPMLVSFSDRVRFRMLVQP